MRRLMSRMLAIENQLQATSFYSLAKSKTLSSCAK